MDCEGTCGYLPQNSAGNAEGRGEMWEDCRVRGEVHMLLHPSFSLTPEPWFCLSPSPHGRGLLCVECLQLIRGELQYLSLFVPVLLHNIASLNPPLYLLLLFFFCFFLHVLMLARRHPFFERGPSVCVRTPRCMPPQTRMSEQGRG
jgi:hypothetical protein